MQIQIHSHSFDVEPKYGEEISIPAYGIQHPGFYVGNGLVIDNSKKRGGVRLISMAEFRDGRKLSYDGFSGPLTPEQVVSNAYAALERGVEYDFLLYNCKDFVRDMRGQSWQSLVIKTAVVAGVVAVGIKAARRL